MGSIRPELFLSEREFARQLGMSIAPVRSAIERLATEGLIFVSPQRGIQVRELSMRELADHYELRELLEPFVCLKIAGRLTPGQVRRLRDNIEALERGVGEFGIEQVIENDTEFHIMLAEFYANAEIIRAITQLRDKITRAIVRVFAQAPERLVEGCQEHVRIAEAIISGQPEIAQAFALEHIRAGMRSVLPSGAWR
jgi:DNA-binding GntR family transcriptional regulator